jgi:ABC-type antimicrobial peptide transport system permease subunit
MAIGAAPHEVRRLVLGEGLALAGLGIGAGLLAALAATSGLKHLVFGVPARDPVAFALVPVLLAVAVVLACLGPARRAAAGGASAVLRP